MSFPEFVLERREEILSRTGEHLWLVAVSILAAVIIGVPLGVLATRRPRLGRPLLAVAGIVQTIPSMALFGFLIPLPFLGGIGARTAIIALVVYALLPVLQGTFTGLKGVAPAIVEAGRGMGMTPRQLLLWVELPLALPVMMAGIRVAAVASVGIATIAAAIGAGGLGTFIFRGVAMVDNRQILLGAVPAAAMAVVADLLLGVVERRLAPAARPRRSPGMVAAAVIVAALALAGAIHLLAPLYSARTGAAGASGGGEGGAGTIVIGSKNFTEQVILGEILATLIESSTELEVVRRFDLGGTFVCHKALLAGELDLYVEYTGTALSAILESPPSTDAGAVYRMVREEYARRFDLVWLAPLGFNNTFALVVRSDDAGRLGLARISDLSKVADRYRAGFGYEFIERADGYKGLAAAYGLHLKERPREMDLGLIYRALAERQVDVVAGNSTDGVIEPLGLVTLEDDRHYFPPYDAAPVARAETLRRHPQVGALLDELAGRISEARMRRMNFAGDSEHRSPHAIAVEFLSGEGLARQP
ncbi:MAG TPA: glycine betaine ABC transporter substrate-binding protein [Candidatus Polarisedimenticolia bacterium]|jgi:osmoprotectant transport system permease protein